MSEKRKPLVGIEDFADSSINIGIRFWVPTSHYFETRYRANAAIYDALQAANITIPFPQREVRILGEEKSMASKRLIVCPAGLFPYILKCIFAL